MNESVLCYKFNGFVTFPKIAFQMLIVFKNEAEYKVNIKATK